MTAIRPRRSALYMPGSNARALEKAREIAADVLILDLEDAVAPDAKATAREQVCAAVRAGGYGRRELVIRVNGPGTPWFEADLAAAEEACPNAILIPKVSDPGTLVETGNRLTALGADLSIALWAMIETPLAILDVERIARAAAIRRRASPASSWVPTTSPRRRGPASFQAGRRCCPGLPARCWPPAPTASTSSTASTTRSGTRRLRSRMPAGPRPRLRRKDADPSGAGGAGERGLRSGRGRTRPRQGDHRRLRPARERRQGRDPARRSHGRAPACRDGTPHRRAGAGDRGLKRQRAAPCAALASSARRKFSPWRPWRGPSPRRSASWPWRRRPSP